MKIFPLFFIFLISLFCVNATTVTMEAASGPTTAFDNQFIFNYDYNGATVTAEFDPVAGNFQAHIVANGLKPSFTYQLKIEGNGSLSSAPTTNEMIGLNGRWWYAGNRDDSYYFANKDTQNIIGYLVFDYFTTDASGAFDGYVSSDASYHVLWCDDDLSGNGDLYPISSEPAYAGETLKCEESTAALCPAASVFGEIERPGFSMLPEGIYDNVLFVLNEESFHVSCGTWTTAMTKVIDFEIDYEANVCGNDVYEPENNEECDNGGANRDNMQPVWNLEEGAGDRAYCSTECIIYRVPGTWCGDGETNGEEECDDGSNADFDGCSATCKLESYSDMIRNDAGAPVGVVTYDSCYPEEFSAVVDTIPITTGVKTHQLKIEGKPSCLYPSGEADDWANEQIGLQGRFWCVQNCPCAIIPAWGGCNIDDNSVYMANKDNPGFCAKGYLLDDCAPSDASGEVHASFAVDSSYETCGNFMNSVVLPAGNYKAMFRLGQDYSPWGTVGTQDLSFKIGDCTGGDVPEFGVIGALAVLAGAGMIVLKKRR